MMGTTSGGYPTISTGYTRAAVRLASSSARKRGSPPMLFCSPPSTHALGSVPDDDLVDRSPRRRREVVAFRIGDGDQRHLEPARRDAQDFGHREVSELVRGRERRAEASAAQRELETPHRGDDR